MAPSASNVSETLIGRIADEYLTRLQHGESPTVDEYAAANPELDGLLRKVLPLVHAGCSIDLPADPLGEVPPRIGEFRIVRAIGRGGMGVVYEAIQEPLGRRVALKVLPAATRFQPQHLERFRREAQAAARLHHTNIVPVYGVGESAGVHFIVMQFIEGQNLECIHGAGTSEKPTAMVAARWGQQAAEAIAHAHANGVLHRDIKPSNIIIDCGGSVWVTDFGLAKLTDANDLTASGDFLGTLRYAAPERLNGETDERSDVYSLGATLYELLAGKPAFDAPSRDALVRQITQDDPTPLRSLTPATPRDLETIVLKALAKEPERRYGTAQAFADDLRRFLDGRAVVARRLSPVERAWRWCRRRPAVAGLLGLSASALIALLFVTLAANRKLETALKDTQAAESRARDNLTDARAAVDQLLTRLGQFKLRGQPEMEQIQSGSLEDALRFYEGFLARNPSDAQVRAETARVFWRAGGIRQQLGQPASAADAYRRAIELLSTTDDELSSDRNANVNLASAYHNLAHSCAHLGQFDTAREAYEKAIVFRLRTPDRRVSLAGTWHNLATLSKDSGRFADAEKLLNQSLETLNEQLGLQPNDHEAEASLAAVLNDSAGLCFETGRVAEAEARYRRSLAIRKKLAHDFPKVMEHRKFLPGVQRNLGYLLMETGRLKDGAAAMKAARDSHAKLASEFPNTPGFRESVADDLGMAGHRFSVGATESRKALSVLEKLVAGHPDIPEYRSQLAQAHHNLALALNSSKDVGPAEEHVRLALTCQTEAIAAVPDALAFRIHLAKHHNLLGVILNGSSRYPESEAAYAEAGRIQEQVVTACPDGIEPAHGWVQSRRNRGKALERLGRVAEAESLYAAALADIEKLVLRVPEITSHWDELIRTRVSIAELLDATNRPLEAQTAYRCAVADGERAVAAFPEKKEYADGLKFLQSRVKSSPPDS